MPNCPLVGLLRFVAYLCAMIGNDVNSLNSPNRPDTWMARILVYYSCISLRDRERTRDTLNTK